MSVYTSVTRSELNAFLQNYELGEAVNYQGITAGIENTNYFVDTTAGHFVLTLFEFLKTEELPFYLELMAFLNERGVPSAHPVANISGYYVQELKGKPATLMQRLQGQSVLEPDTPHCESIGLALAKLHIAGRSFYLKQENVRGAKWRQKTGEQLLPLLNPENAEILQRELNIQAASDFQSLPRGVIHADLFRDNALFVGNELSGILDFYYACNDSYLYDIAIAVNDWCAQPDGSLNFKRAQSLCQAYQSIRLVTGEEQKAWPLILRQAALRFWLSRLWDSRFPKAGEMTFQKDPDEFKRILLARIAESAQLGSLWQT
jgi:homoserine kinase type II